MIVDKNARIGDGVRLTNDAVQEADGDGYYIRGGIIVTYPKDGVIKAGTGV